jgi:phage-related minor tail protein
VMGEAGPEAVMPLERGPGGRLGVRASGGGGGGITQVINIDARNADSGVDQKIRAAITIASQQANAQLLADISRGGSTAKQVGRRG